MDQPMLTTRAPAVILLAAPQDHPLAAELDQGGWTVDHVHTGTLAVAALHDIQPDIVLVAAELPDMTGAAVCGILSQEPRVDHFVPMLILVEGEPTPEQRVAALREGAWGFLNHPIDAQDLELRLSNYVLAKQNIDLAMAEGLIDTPSGLLSRQALARRARELGALMSRQRAGLACVVFELGTDPPDRKTGSIVARSARVSDAVGALSPVQVAVVAPGTGGPGVVSLAQRVGSAMLGLRDGGGLALMQGVLRVGYDAVGNLSYAPMDPAEMLARASAAVNGGVPEPGVPWVRRFEGGTAPGSAGRVSPAGRLSPAELGRGITPW
jgi:CheY-like chemotaxis protein